MDIGKLIFFIADFIRIFFGAIFQAAFGLASLVALNWIWIYAFDKVLIQDMYLMMNLIFYIFIPCYIIVFFISDLREYKKNDSEVVDLERLGILKYY